MKLRDAMEYARDYATVDAWRSRTLRMPLQRSTEILARLRAEVNRLTARMERVTAQRADGVTVPRELLLRLADLADESANACCHLLTPTIIERRAQWRSDAQAARRAAAEET